VDSCPKSSAFPYGVRLLAIAEFPFAKLVKTFVPAVVPSVDQT
jgi:hypothetical protein